MYSIETRVTKHSSLDCRGELGTGHGSHRTLSSEGRGEGLGWGQSEGGRGFVQYGQARRDARGLVPSKYSHWQGRKFRGSKWFELASLSSML